MDFSLLVCLLLLPFSLSLSLLSGWRLNLRNHFLLKGERSFHRREKVSCHPVFCTSPSFFLSGLSLVFSCSVQTPWGPNLVGNQAVSQVAKNPLNRTTAQRREASQGQLEKVATNGTNHLSPKLTRGQRRGNWREEVISLIFPGCWIR